MANVHKITLVLMFCLLALGRAEYLKYKDPKQPIAVRVKDLLSRMTLAEKIGQMTQIERENATADALAKYFIGSVLSGGGSVPSPQASAEAWASMVTEMQKGALSTRLGIPIIYGIDAVHGHNNVYKATIFPHNVGLGATRDPDLVKRIGEATALEVRATGIPYVFAPCIAVCRDPRWGRCYESYSEDPKVVQSLTSLISGLQGDAPADSVGRPYVGGSKKVAACAKHYVGDGGTYKGINENNTIINTHGLMSIHMPPYYNSIIRGVSTVMVSYSSWNGEKMHANHFLVTDFLKNKLKFRGFVISDWEGIDRITSPPHANYSYSIEAGVGAGIDMIMVPFRYTEFIDDLTTQVQNKVIPMSRIDDAVYRILRVKFTMGLFENPYPDASLAGELGKQEHRELAREAVRKSLVLLKNGKSSSAPLLPLPKKAGKILVAGSHANDLGNQCGGWTITWQGSSGNTTAGHRRCQHAGGVLREPGQQRARRQVRLRGRGGRGAAVRGDVRRQPEPDDPGARAERDPVGVQGHQVRGGPHLRQAPGGGAVPGRHGRVRGGVAARVGGAGRRGRAVRRLRVHGEAVADVVQVGGPAAHERGRQALRPALPVRLRAHHTRASSMRTTGL